MKEPTVQTNFNDLLTTDFTNSPLVTNESSKDVLIRQAEVVLALYKSNSQLDAAMYDLEQAVVNAK